MELTTQNLLLNLLLFSGGIGVLIIGSNGVIEGATVIARNFGIPDLVIGITLVSIGTSLPELATNIYAALIDESGVAIGTVIGSNITNVLLVAGIAVVGLKVIVIDKVMFRRDAVAMIVVYVLFSLFCYSGNGPLRQINRVEGLVLLLGCVAYIFLLLKVQKKAPSLEQRDQGNIHRGVLVKSILKTTVSCLWVVLGAKLIVDNVVWLGRKLEIPEELISATVIALGTSLPEVAVTISGIAKGKRDMALGNIIGSNIFNILLIMGVTASIASVPVSHDVCIFLIPFMLLTGVGFVTFMRTSWTLVRWEGVVFLLGYVAFIWWNVVNMRS